MNNENRDWKDMVGDFFQGLADLIDRAAEPIFSLIAVLIPFLAPVVIAQITATALVDGHILIQEQANQLALVIEGIGIVGLAGLVLAIDKWIRSKNEKMDAMIYLLGTIDVLYFLFLISVNVLLDATNPNVTTVQTVIKAIICLVPLMAGGIFGYYRIVHKDKIARKEAKNEAYQLRQEQREDRLKAKALKQGINVFAPQGQMVTNQQTVPQVHEKHASDYKEYAFELLDAQFKSDRTLLTPRQLTTLVNKNKRVNLDHNKCKGTWTNFTREWKQSRGL